MRPADVKRPSETVHYVAVVALVPRSASSDPVAPGLIAPARAAPSAPFGHSGSRIARYALPPCVTTWRNDSSAKLGHNLRTVVLAVPMRPENIRRIAGSAEGHACDGGFRPIEN